MFTKFNRPFFNVAIYHLKDFLKTYLPYRPIQFSWMTVEKSLKLFLEYTTLYYVTSFIPTVSYGSRSMHI